MSKLKSLNERKTVLQKELILIEEEIKTLEKEEARLAYNDIMKRKEDSKKWELPEIRNKYFLIKAKHRTVSKDHDGYCSGRKGEDAEEEEKELEDVFFILPKTHDLSDIKLKSSGCSSEGLGYCHGFYKNDIYYDLKIIRDNCSYFDKEIDWELSQYMLFSFGDDSAEELSCV
jgi:hypothetical protein